MYSHGSSSWAPAIHTKTLCSCLCSPFQSPQCMTQSSTVCFPFCIVLKAAPRDSCDLSSPPSVSSKVTFLRSGNLLRNSLQAPCTLTSSVRMEAKPRLDMVLLSLGNKCVRVVLPRGAIFQTWGTKFPATRSALLQRPTLHHQGEKVVELLCPFQRYMHDTMKQKELGPTCATPQLHNWAIRWLNLQLSSHPTIAAAEQLATSLSSSTSAVAE